MPAPDIESFAFWKRIGKRVREKFVDVIGKGVCPLHNASFPEISTKNLERRRTTIGDTKAGYSQGMSILLLSEVTNFQ